MSLLHRIPPMVSALAFGYGVGMAAPESTISSMHSAVAGANPEPRYAEPSAAPARTPSPAIRIADPVGDESRELMRLRALRDQDSKRAESCELDRPTYSRPPRYESR